MVKEGEEVEINEKRGRKAVMAERKRKKEKKC